MQTLLRKSLLVSGLALGAAIIGRNAMAGPDDTLRWQSVIGIAQANDLVGSGTGAVTGGGTPWSTLDGRVNVILEHGAIAPAVDDRFEGRKSERPEGAGRVH